MANIQISKPSFKEWAKDPKTAMLILMTSLLSVLFYVYISSNDARVSDCKETITYVRGQYSEMMKENAQIVKDNLYQRQLNAETVRVADSIIHKEAQKVLK